MKNFKHLLVASTALLTANFAFAQTWTQTSAPSNTWTSVACSADETKIAATAGDGIYISTNSGTTWTQTSAPNDVWTSVASSADGTILVAAAAFSSIYISTNSGATWSLTTAPSHQFNWDSVASSADGTKLVAGAGSGGIYTSTNSGATWSLSSAPSGFTNYWPSIASSVDGCKLIAAGNQSINGIISDGSIYTSTDSGATWILQSNAPDALWHSVASTADGSKLVATVYRGAIYASTNAGVNWTQIDQAYSGGWGTVVSSADGNKLAAAYNFPILTPTNVQNYSQVYFSSDSGATWASIGAPAGDSISCKVTALSADGNKLVAIANGNIYIWQSTPAPQLNIKPASGNLTLSWIIPSTNFVMQQSSDLGSWTDVTNAPVLNLTNLQNEVILSPSSSSGFYRLKTP